jgi:hypothetical protein
VTSYHVHGGQGYLVTSKDAPRYKVVRTPLAKPDFAQAEVVLPEGELVPASVHSTKTAVFVNTTRDGARVIVRIDPAGKMMPARITPPEKLTGSVVEASPYFNEAYVSTESWTKGGALYTYDPVKRNFAVSALQPAGAFDQVPGYTSKEVEVKSHDGVMVPLSILYKEGLALDGSHPLLISGYGAYGFIRYVSFNPLNLAWLERGGVLAVAHVRGGGERGKQWHLAGQKATKPNTWKDLIACAEYLIAEKYTSTPKLGIQGGSAGGILIGRAITERPDLFQAAIIQVGVTDTLRFETTENGPPNVEEMGSVSTPGGFKTLLAMSTLHNVRDGVKYPAVLCTHGLNDHRTEPWLSAKITGPPASCHGQRQARPAAPRHQSRPRHWLLAHPEPGAIGQQMELPVVADGREGFSTAFQVALQHGAVSKDGSLRARSRARTFPRVNSSSRHAGQTTVSERTVHGRRIPTTGGCVPRIHLERWRDPLSRCARAVPSLHFPRVSVGEPDTHRSESQGTPVGHRRHGGGSRARRARVGVS